MDWPGFRLGRIRGGMGGRRLWCGHRQQESESDPEHEHGRCLREHLPGVIRGNGIRRCRSRFDCNCDAGGMEMSDGMHVGGVVVCLTVLPAHYGGIAPRLPIGNAYARLPGLIVRSGWRRRVKDNPPCLRIFPVAEPGFSGADGGMKTAVPIHGAAVSRTAWIWPVALAAIIFASSSRSQIVNVGGIPGLDKVVHFAVYGILGVLICRLGRGVRATAIAILLASAYGASDEWHQSFVPSRSAEVADWFADTLGATVVVGCYAGSARLRHWMETPARTWRRILGRTDPASSR